jgi:hypothetical protein
MRTMTKLKTYLKVVRAQITKPWVWGVVLAINGVSLLVSPSEQFGKMAAFGVGVSFTAAAYSFVFQLMDRTRERMRKCLDEQHEMMTGLLEMKTGEIGKEIAEHMGAVLVERPDITKH